MSKPLVSDELWSRVEPLLPRPKLKNRHVRYAGRKPSEPRAVFAGILFVLTTGIPWKSLPATSDFPSGHTCRRALVRWHKLGVWKKLHQVLLSELNHDGKLDWSRAIADSSSVRAIHGGRKTGPSSTDRRKRGSKHHILVDANGVPLAAILTKANRPDVTQLLALIEKVPLVRGRPGRPRRKPRKVQGDRGYDSNAARAYLKKKG